MVSWSFSDIGIQITGRVQRVCLLMDGMSKFHHPIIGGYDADETYDVPREKPITGPLSGALERSREHNALAHLEQYHIILMHIRPR